MSGHCLGLSSGPGESGCTGWWIPDTSETGLSPDLVLWAIVPFIFRAFLGRLLRFALLPVRMCAGGMLAGVGASDSRIVGPFTLKTFDDQRVLVEALQGCRISCNVCIPRRFEDGRPWPFQCITGYQIPHGAVLVATSCLRLQAEGSTVALTSFSETIVLPTVAPTSFSETIVLPNPSGWRVSLPSAFREKIIPAARSGECSPDLLYVQAVLNKDGEDCGWRPVVQFKTDDAALPVSVLLNSASIGFDRPVEHMSPHYDDCSENELTLRRLLEILLDDIKEELQFRSPAATDSLTGIACLATETFAGLENVHDFNGVIVNEYREVERPGGVLSEHRRMSQARKRIATTARNARGEVFVLSRNVAQLLRRRTGQSVVWQRDMQVQILNDRIQVREVNGDLCASGPVQSLSELKPSLINGPLIAFFVEGVDTVGLELETWRTVCRTLSESNYKLGCICFLRLCCWHLLQPVVYLWIFLHYIDELAPVQQMIGSLVAGREVLYILLCVLGVVRHPSFLVFDIDKNFSSLWNHGILESLFFLLAPEKFLSFCLGCSCSVWTHYTRIWSFILVGLVPAISLVCDLGALFGICINIFLPYINSGAKAIPQALVVGYGVTSLGFLVGVIPVVARACRAVIATYRSQYGVGLAASVALIIVLSFAFSASPQGSSTTPTPSPTTTPNDLLPCGLSVISNMILSPAVLWIGNAKFLTERPWFLRLFQHFSCAIVALSTNVFMQYWALKGPMRIDTYILLLGSTLLSLCGTKWMLFRHRSKINLLQVVNGDCPFCCEVVHDQLSVTTTSSPESAETTHLAQGVLVEVLERHPIPIQGKVRARIQWESGTGWISLVEGEEEEASVQTQQNANSQRTFLGLVCGLIGLAIIVVACRRAGLDTVLDSSRRAGLDTKGILYMYGIAFVIPNIASLIAVLLPVSELLWSIVPAALTLGLFDLLQWFILGWWCWML